MLYFKELHCSIIMKLVSIIIPYYKNVKFIKETIYSILNQTYKNFEIIIVYDDENHADLSTIKQIIKNQSKIKLIINKKNLGAGLSRNIGILNAKGDYLAFIDSDDYWNNEKLQVQLNIMLTQKKDFTHTSYQIVDEMGNFKGYRKAKNFNNLKELLKSCDIGLSTVMIKKILFQKNILFPNLKTKEDYVLWLKLSKKGIVFDAIETNLAKWRSSKLSLSSSTIQKIKDAFLVYSKYEKLSMSISLYRVLILSLSYIKKKIKNI